MNEPLERVDLFLLKKPVWRSVTPSPFVEDLLRPTKHPPANRTEAKKRQTTEAHVNPKAYLPREAGMEAALKTSRALTNSTLMTMSVIVRKVNRQ